MSPLTGVSLRLNGSRIPNHGYVDLSKVDNDTNTMQCHTDLTTCCVQKVGSERGDWYAPNGPALPTAGAATTQQPTYHRIDLLYHGNHGSGAVSGIYQCSIAVSTVKKEMVYVGLYSSGGEGRVVESQYTKQTYTTYCCLCAGDVTVPDGMTFTEDSDLNGSSPQFTLTCISTGGPATTVTWTRDSQTVSGGVTVLDNPVTAQYTHTLNVTERLEGLYQCNVTNNKPSTATAQLTVAGIAHKHSVFAHNRE